MTRQPTPDIMGDVLTGTPPAGVIEQRSVNDLHPHPRNDTVYGDRSDPDLVASVRIHGVLNPLLITADGVIISGHRRWDAARIAGLATVPVVVYDGSDDLDIIAAMIESNRQRQKTNEQLAREAKALLDIETERAKRRQGTRTDLANIVVNSPQCSDAGKARQKAGEQLGIGGQKVDKLVKVIEAADTLRADGNDEAADDLVKTLNKRSAHAAYTQAQRQGYISKPPPEPVTPTLPIVSTATAIWCNDSRKLGDPAYLADIPVEHDTVDLVITSPPYNVGIEYGQHSDNLEHLEYLELLRDVFTGCWKVMRDGARIAVVVPFGVGRNPWQPVSLFVASVLQKVGFTLRGQIIWDKGSSGNRTSWGSFRSPSDPSLRDTSECILIAHKATSRAILPDSVLLRDDKGSYSPWLASSDYFMELAQDHWQVAPESAQRIGHPAPFPVELVRRLIHFYGWPGCLTLDPFGGAGTVGVAATELGCDAVLIEKDADYCALARRRIDAIYWERHQ